MEVNPQKKSDTIWKCRFTKRKRNTENGIYTDKCTCFPLKMFFKRIFDGLNKSDNTCGEIMTLNLCIINCE